MARALMLVAVLALTACSARGSAANAARFERSAGIGTAPDIQMRVDKIFRLHQFEIEREAEPPTMYWETRWRNRAPFADEQALGVNVAQIRLIVRTAPRGSTSPAGQLYDVNLAIQTRVQTVAGSDWSEAIATPQYREYAQRIYDDLKRELEIGVRRYD